MRISLVIPCYNEELSLPILLESLEAVRAELSDYAVDYIFVDDGSKDATRRILRESSAQMPHLHYISFSRNFGKEAAIYAGLSQSEGDLVAILDADMQDPPSLIPEMVRLIRDEEFEIVATRRVTREGEPPIRSFFARQFYKLINRMSDVEIVDGARDFRLMKREVVEAVLSLSERQRFSKGIFSWIGFRTHWLEFQNIQRAAGETKWSFWKLFKYAIEGIVAFTTVPLRLATITGFCVSGAAFIYMVYYVIRAILLRIYNAVPGYPSLLAIMLFLGGLILLAQGILGEYLARTYMEVKHRPLYIIRENSDDHQNHSHVKIPVDADKSIDNRNPSSMVNNDPHIG